MSLNVKLTVLTLIAVLVLVNWSIYGKEQHLKNGKIVYLELAPVDPRSLMQGDYMALRFALGQAIQRALPRKKTDRARPWRQLIPTSDGHVIVKLDERHVAKFQQLDTEPHSLEENEIRLRYRVRHGRVKFASNAFYFQEGQGEIYEPARYGRFRVDDDGELLLVGLHDANLQRLDPSTDRSSRSE